jgi:hypothetical protein
MGFISEFKRAYDKDSVSEEHFGVAGQIVACSHCGGKDFAEGSALLNSRGLTFLNLDWANQDASLLICRKCSHIEWFLDKPEKVSS